jgi:deoxyadenosine/deoxycytidine kinase
MNVIYLCGPHAAGKSTLIDALAENPVFLLPILETRMSKFHADPFTRIQLKHAQRVIENYETEQIAKINPARIVLGNRCNYDTKAYADAYKALGWITHQQHEHVENLRISLWHQTQQKAIVLNPPYATIESRLTNRWKYSEKKWREEDLEYLHAACKAYEQFRGQQGIIYIEDNGVKQDLLEEIYELSK